MRSTLLAFGFSLFAAVAGAIESASAQSFVVQRPNGGGCTPVVTTLSAVGLPTPGNSAFGFTLFSQSSPMANSVLHFGFPITPAAIPSGLTAPGTVCEIAVAQQFNLPFFLPIQSVGILNFPIPPGPALVGVTWDVQALSVHTNNTVSASSTLVMGI